jgi:acyl-CoA synthetase (AMP-forming)/AMP-acid ligase II
MSFAGAWERGVRLANALLAHSLKQGDRIGMPEDNCIEAVDFYLRHKGTHRIIPSPPPQ